MKVAVDGTPYLRKVDLETYGGYRELLTAVQAMFSSCFTIGEVLIPFLSNFLGP